MSDTPISLLRKVQDVYRAYPRHDSVAMGIIMDRIDHCLAEHADDGEPVTEEWLRENGFSDMTYQGQTVLALKFRIEPCNWSQWIEVGPATLSHGLFGLRAYRFDDDDGEAPPPDYLEVKARTRGDVRELIRVLGGKSI